VNSQRDFGVGFHAAFVFPADLTRVGAVCGLLRIVAIVHNTQTVLRRFERIWVPMLDADVLLINRDGLMLWTFVADKMSATRGKEINTFFLVDGCNKARMSDYENVSIMRSTHTCDPSSPDQDVRTTIMFKRNICPMQTKQPQANSLR
jgi:hypothetical protein